jgi:hypothetical protein
MLGSSRLPTVTFAHGTREKERIQADLLPTLAKAA